MTSPNAGEGELAGLTIAIVGVGFMGGSLGSALAGSGAHRVGVVTEADSLADAVSLGCVDAVARPEDVLPTADLVVMCVPTRAAIELLADWGSLYGPTTVVTDVCSTKAAVIEAYEQLPDHVDAVGGHPMCGAATPGRHHADPTIFDRATWVVCPCERTSLVAARRVEALIGAVGSAPVRMDAAAHDRAAAVASHLPYVTGQALLHLMQARATENPVTTALASTGFASATRVAQGGDRAMWRDILITNRDEIARAIDDLGDTLADLRQLLDEPDALAQWLTPVRRLR